MKKEGFKISQYACAVLLIVSSIALVAYQVIEIIPKTQPSSSASSTFSEVARIPTSSSPPPTGFTSHGTPSPLPAASSASGTISNSNPRDSPRIPGQFLH